MSVTNKASSCERAICPLCGADQQSKRTGLTVACPVASMAAFKQPMTGSRESFAEGTETHDDDNNTTKHISHR